MSTSKTKALVWTVLLLFLCSFSFIYSPSLYAIHFGQKLDGNTGPETEGEGDTCEEENPDCCSATSPFQQRHGRG